MNIFCLCDWLFWKFGFGGFDLFLCVCVLGFLKKTPIWHVEQIPFLWNYFSQVYLELAKERLSDITDESHYLDTWWKLLLQTRDKKQSSWRLTWFILRASNQHLYLSNR